jgi:hypothetical protein
MREEALKSKQLEKPNEVVVMNKIEKIEKTKINPIID